GNYMGALAMVHVDIGVSALFQITPSTQGAEWLMEFKRLGMMPHTKLLLMNGEDDAFTACHTASQCGSTVGTFTCSQGALFAAQVIKSLGGSRCPVVTLFATRTTSAPISIHASHDDVMFFKDCGIITLFARNPQEVYDLTLLAFKIGQDAKVQLPVIVAYDGFDVSHTVTSNDVLNEHGVLGYRKWLGKYKRPNSLLSLDHAVSLGGLALPHHHMDIVYAQLMAMENAADVSKIAIAEFSERFWKIPDLINGYKMEDAEYAIVSLGSTFGTTREAVDVAREKGIKVGALSIMSYRPFPVHDVREALGRMKAVAVLDRAPTFGTAVAQLGADVAGVFYNSPLRPDMMNCIYGIGGRTLSVEHTFEQIIHPLVHERDAWIDAARPVWVGVNGGK
ncbi:MAG: ferredoxin oxidoreductase, partial [Candidatus Paceibacterota bacterium]